LSNHLGYPSHELIKNHHLLSSFYILDKNEMQNPKGIIKNIKIINEIINSINPDLIIDFEPYGLETTILSLVGRLKYKVKTVGINEVFPRGLFYTEYAPSMKKFAKIKNKSFPLNYTDRDFVVLHALGIERGNIEIEINETEKGKTFRENLKNILGVSEETKLFGINIGCGTEGTENKRPDFNLLKKVLIYVYKKYNYTPVLFGAPFEKKINDEFLKLFENEEITVFDIAGKTDILELVGAINTMEIFISSDSGPYHIATALRKPNVAIFNFENPQHYNINPWTRCVVASSEKDFEKVKKAIDEVVDWKLKH
jgi:ADP-heptose:LPS heptosyltransferase